jgi:hypothetical protein
LVMMSLAFLSSYMYKSTNTIVHGYNLLTLMIRNVESCQTPLALNEGRGKMMETCSFLLHLLF